MAGIWERVTVDPTDEAQLRLNVSLLETELTGVALGIRTRAAAKANLEAELGQALSGAEATDLAAIADEFDAGTTQQRLVYAHKIKFVLNAAELQLIDETEFRAVLGI